MADVKWIKIATGVFDDEKIMLLESLPASDSIIVIWFKLLVLAGKQNNSGVFMLNDRLAYTDEMLATIFRRDVGTVKLALQAFEGFGMIEIIEGVITIPNWGKHQSLDSLENKKEYQKNYMREYRQKQKSITCKTNSKANSEANVSSLEEDKDKEEREEDKEDKEDKKEIQSKNTKKETVKSVFEYYTGGELLNVLMDFAEMRKSTNAKLTPRAAQMICNKLDTLADNDIDKIKIVENSIMNSWKGIFALKQDSNTGSSYKQQPTTQDLLQSEGVQAFLRGE